MKIVDIEVLLDKESDDLYDNCDSYFAIISVNPDELEDIVYALRQKAISATDFNDVERFVELAQELQNVRFNAGSKRRTARQDAHKKLLNDKTNIPPEIEEILKDEK